MPYTLPLPFADNPPLPAEARPPCKLSPAQLRQLDTCLKDVDVFIEGMCGLKLRAYQRGVARAIIESVINRAGRSFVVMFPRQSGKNELQAQIESYLLTIFWCTRSEMVKVSPTWKPQTLNAMRRLERVLEVNLAIQDFWTRESGYIYRSGLCRLAFFSGQPTSNIVGATADVLLQVDEAQDVVISKYDKEIAPMAASTNATRVFWGTAWTARTLLARELRLANEQQRRDGIRRVFVVNADEVAREVPAYGEFVAEQVARLGRNHPMVKTQYFSEEIEAEGGMFPPARQALMHGRHPPSVQPEPGKVYAMTLDVAGEDEGVVDAADGWQPELFNPRRDSTALTIFEVDLDSLQDELLRKPTYKVVQRQVWVGVKHARLYARIKALADLFEARYLVVDATGVGAGLTSFLAAALGGKVIPFEFNTRTKSDLCWNFLGIIDSGRYKEYAMPSPPKQDVIASAARQSLCFGGIGVESVSRGSETNLAGEPGALQALFWQQAAFCEFAIQPGPQKTVRWGVPDGTRDPANGELVHDDLLISAALAAVLDEQEWSAGGAALVVPGRDPLEELDRGF